MKKLFFSLLAIGLISLPASAQTGTKSGATVQVRNIDHVSGKRWKVTNFLKNGMPVTPKPQDFAWFRPRGDYESSLNGIFRSGTWSYDKAAKTVTTVINGKTRVWNVIETSATVLKVKEGAEEIHFAPDAVINTDASVTGTPAMISKKWTVQSHSLGGVSATYKPGDFYRFFPDGTFDMVSQGIYTIGKWSYSAQQNTITITIGTNVSSWLVKSITEAKIEMKKQLPAENLILVQ